MQTISPKREAAEAALPASALPTEAAGEGGGEADEPLWPEDWRARMAEGDGKLERRLERFKSPRTILESMLSAEQRIRGGSEETAGAETADRIDASPTELEGGGVPDDPSGYDLDLGDGQVVGEEDRAEVESFFEAAHAAGLSKDQVKGALAWYYQRQDAVRTDLARRDAETHEDAQAALAEAWGADFRKNVNLISSFLEETDPEVIDLLSGARFADGRRFADSPETMNWLAGLARRQAAAGAIGPTGQGVAGHGLEDEIAKIEAFMRSDRDAYFKDEKTQTRYRQLLERRGGR